MCVQTKPKAPSASGDHLTRGDGFLTRTMDTLRQIWDRILAGGHKFLEDLHVYEMMDEAAIYLAQHPILTVVVIAIAISCGIPILMFVVFAILTVLFTFAGFIVIEGTLLTVGSVLLCGFVMAILIILVIIAATVGIAYLGFIEVYGLFQNSPENSPLARFLPKKPPTQQSTVTPVAHNHED